MSISAKNQRAHAGDIDPALSEQYRSIATESAPDALDSAVLRAARASLGKDGTPAWQPDWFRSAAFIVMAALSFALILEMNDANILPTDVQTGGRSLAEGDSASVFQEATQSVTEQIRDAEETAGSALQNSGEDALAATDAEADTDRAIVFPGNPVCDEKQRSTMASWWQCIEALESGGASDAAERELTELMRAFPAFVRPDQR
jgi:hypothetical protein